jgi:hypothetical protein
MSHTKYVPGASEIKFVVDHAAGETIRAWAREHLDADPHGSGPSSDVYDTTTLYFDTGNRDVFNRRGSNGRAKYRIRRYGGGDVIFIERKLRTSSALTKRRTQIAPADLDKVRPADDLDRRSLGEGGWPGDWFTRRLAARGLAPVCQVAYRRTARGVETSTGMARLTIDEALHAIDVDGIRFRPQAGIAFLDGQQIVEMKFRSTMPAVFKRLIEELKLSPTTVSKYRLGMMALGEGVAVNAATQ